MKFEHRGMADLSKRRRSARGYNRPVKVSGFEPMNTAKYSLKPSTPLWRLKFQLSQWGRLMFIIFSSTLAQWTHKDYTVVSLLQTNHHGTFLGYSEKREHRANVVKCGRSTGCHHSSVLHTKTRRIFVNSYFC